jgi:hypothetical protein
MVALKPLACKSLAKEAAIMPFPREEVTPPVIKIYLVVEPIRRVGWRILFGFLWDSKVGEKFDLEVRCVKEKNKEVFLG